MSEDFKTKFERAAKAFYAEMGREYLFLISAKQMRGHEHSTASNMPLEVQITFLRSALNELQKHAVAAN